MLDLQKTVSLAMVTKHFACDIAHSNRCCLCKGIKQKKADANYLEIT
jgi:hypothetical protein